MGWDRDSRKKRRVEIVKSNEKNEYLRGGRRMNKKFQQLDSKMEKDEFVSMASDQEEEQEGEAIKGEAFD